MKLKFEKWPNTREFFRDPNKTQTIALWLAAVTVGFASVGYAKLFKAAEDFFFATTATNPKIVFVICPIAFLIAWLIVLRFAPNAGGSGIPQIMAANEMAEHDLNPDKVHALLSLRTAFFKVISSLLCVIGGGAIGREGPTLQISASIFYFFSKHLKRFEPKVHTQSFIVAGAAAGLASAFNTPLGGIVYAIEELGSHHFHRFKTTLLSAVIISGLIAQWLLGSYLYLGSPTVLDAGASFVPSALLAGAVSGLAGAVFSWSLFRLVKLRWKIQSKIKLAAVTIICGLFVAALYCYNQNASGTGLHIITDFLFHDSQAQPSLILIRALATAVSYLSGAAGGIFSPSLAIGASIGAEISTLISSPNHNLMVLLGMIGFLTGVTRTPFTSFILVIEMSDRHAAILPMMIAALMAQFCASMVTSKSFYEEVKDRYLEAQSKILR